MEQFTKRKQDCLNKQDKSSIGSWDKHIERLCDKINKLENYYTLSSCSGRIVLIRDLDKKQEGMFIFRSHEKVKSSQLMKTIKDYSGKENLMFKMEPCILHIACKTLEDAEKMLNKARFCGWKNSGIMSMVESRIVLELRSTESLALPIFFNKKLLVDDEFLSVLVKESNKKLQKTWDKIEKLEKSL
jgi:tRNA wybutosine-synthesizing protein 3